MDNNLAVKLFEEGGTLVVLNMPVGTEFGIDMNTWNVGPKFKGVKMIPPGLHFVYFSAVSKEGQVAPRTGYFYEFKGRDIILKNYNQTTEDFDQETDEVQEERVKGRLKELDGELGAYPLDSWKNWVSLVSQTTINDVKRVMPLNGKLCSAPELIHDESKPYKSNDVPYTHDTDGSNENLRKAEESMPQMKHKIGTELRFTKFPKKNYKDGSSPSEITKCSLDTTYSLECVVSNLEKPSDILAELQLSFVCFIVGQMWEGWEHWKTLIGTICKGEQFLIKNPDIYKILISVLHFQIDKVPEDLFMDIVENNNFLAAALTELFANIEDNNNTLPKELISKSKKFKSHIRHKFGWDLSVENDDDGPVIVNVD